MPGVAAAGDIIEALRVDVNAAPGAPNPPERIAERMSASVSTIGEHVLLGRRLDEVAVNKEAYEKLIKEVFDRVLVGYSVSRVAITGGKTAHIQVEVLPWGEVVQTVTVTVDFTGISPPMQALINKDMGNIQGEIGNILVGLPIDATDWAGGVCRSFVRDTLAAQLPEFYVDMEITPGAQTSVRVSLHPRGTIVQDSHSSLHSRTMPILFLSQLRPVLEQQTKQFNGLPVAFLERHRVDITANLTEAAAHSSLVRRYGLQLSPTLTIGADTEVSLEAETQRYKIWLEGYLDMGRPANSHADSTSALLHIGKYMDKRSEVFVEANVIPSTTTWQFMAGLGYQLTPSTAIGLKCNFSGQERIAWLNQYISQNWRLRLERDPASGRHELGIRYKIDDLLSAEYIFSNNENWLRLVGNL